MQVNALNETWVHVFKFGSICIRTLTNVILINLPVMGAGEKSETKLVATAWEKL